jgi:hypothetical protein
MPRNSEIDRLVSAAQLLLERYKFADPNRMHGDEHYRHLLHLSVLSPLDKAPPPEDGDGRAPMFGINHAYDDQKGAQLIASACSGDTNADVVLSAIAAYYVRTGCAMPPRLREYMSRKLDAAMLTGEPWPKPRRKRRPRNGNHRRDFIIATVVSALVKGGLPVESGRAQHSAASIVADALTNLGITLDDRSVVRIWKANRDLAQLFRIDALS